MTQTQPPPNSFDPFSQWQTVRDRGMESWSKMMTEFVHSDEYAAASAQWLDTYLALSKSFQNLMDEAMTQTLSQYKVPSTDDLTRLAERLWNVELKLDDLDARMDQVLGLLNELAARPVPSEPPPPAPSPRPPTPVAEVPVAVAEPKPAKVEAPTAPVKAEAPPEPVAVKPAAKKTKATPREAAAGQE